MSTQTHVDVWVVLREDMRLRLGEEVFDRWIAGLKLLSEDGESIRLGVANKFVLDWIQKRYLSVMESLLRDRQGGLEVRLEIDPALYQQARREQDEVFGAAGRAASGAPGEPEGRDRPEDRDEQTLESFVVGESNVHAYNAVVDVLERPGRLYNPLFIFGPTGVGKTHLLKGIYRAVRGRRRGGSAPGGSERWEERPAPSREEGPRSPFLRVSYLTGEQFFQHYVASIQDRTVRRFQERYRALDILILDDVHLLVNKRKTQIEFLHTFSALGDSGRQVILASDVPPRDLKELDAGLVGRFSSGLVVGVKKPDPATRLGIARAVAARLGLRVDPSVLESLAESLRGNAREIAGAVKQVHHHARMRGGTITPEQAREVIAGYLHERSRRVDLQRIHEAVAVYFGLTAEALSSAGRQRHVALARQVAMYLARVYTRRSLAEIGKHFGNRNHTTVKSAQDKVRRMLQDEGSTVAKDVAAIIESLEA
ncbi:MAG: chromosomal replication initiator protein DnaA [Planctomycetes bacterium]|nr:chromosomal replication initiator protein DnaA [Planctomycetota bacterium]